MTESSQFVTTWGYNMDGSVYQMVNAVNPGLKQDVNYTQTKFDVNILDQKMSLSQYYSQFVDDMPDYVPSTVDFSEAMMPTQPLLQNNVITYNLCNEKEARKPTTRKPKIWKCARNCGKIFTQERYMRNHILVMHEKASSIQCKICSLYLSTKARLKNHMIRHSGVNRFVCLICVNKKANDKSCMRHHLSEKHGINSKHPFFHESYYEMSLKEMSLVKKSKGNDWGDDEDYAKHTSVCKKSANDIEELKRKIMDKSTRVKNLLGIANLPVKNERSELIKVEVDPSVCINNVFQFCLPDAGKIVTAENGMKLMKLPNGEFTKIITN